MREILFRGKRKDNGEWVENHTVVELRDGQKYIPNNSAPSGLKIDENGNKVSFIALFHEVIPETVGQYTGLTDKNGKKIFEGDVVKAECDLYHGENKKERVTHIGTVIYDKKFCQFGINVAGFSKCYVLNRWKGDYNEVIGNIHDNSELLKGGAE